MKPEWEDAPEWANWLTQDIDLCWYWHELEPKFVDGGFWLNQGGKMLPADIANLPSIEKRPTNDHQLKNDE